MDPRFSRVQNDVYQDLTYLGSLNKFALEYLVGEVIRNSINDETNVVYGDNLDVIGRISYDLEGEGLYLSNEKILKILLALRQLCKAVYRGYMKTLQDKQTAGEEVQPTDVIAELLEALKAQLTTRTGLKENIISVLIESMKTLLTEQLTAIATEDDL